MTNFYDRLEKHLETLDKKVTEIAANLKIGNNYNAEDIFFDNQEFIQLMNISKRTAQDWRTKNIINFSQVGNKIYYKLSDVQKLINEHYNG